MTGRARRGSVPVALVLAVGFGGLSAQDTPPPDTVAGDSVPVFQDLGTFFASLPVVEPEPLNADIALWLAAMPLSCLDHPVNRPNSVPYLWEVHYTPVEGFETNRAFYGCFDWHSAVNSTWTLVTLLKRFPDHPSGPVIRSKLDAHLGASNLAGELAFFRDLAGDFELPYGYAWLLRLQGELRTWNDPDAFRWAAAIQPLADLLARRMIDYLGELDEPSRSGAHPNTAMAMDNMLDYATQFDPALEAAIREAAERLFRKDTDCPTQDEPGGSDFLSPCLMEAAVMSRLLQRDDYLNWLESFLPPIHSVEFRPLTETLGPEFVANPEQLAARSHIISLAFVRGTSMGQIANTLPPGDERIAVLRRLAAMQAAKGFEVIAAAGYWGSHFLATWAVTYLLTVPT